MRAILITLIAIWIIAFSVILKNFVTGVNTYEYSNADGSFTFEVMPSKGRDIRMMKWRHDEFLASNVPSDTVLYRTFKKHYWKFWLWVDYYNAELYQFPYKSWEQIKAQRGVIIDRSQYQEF